MNVPAMLYGSECWPITKAQANRVEVAELRMLRWTCGKNQGRDDDTNRRPQTAPVRRVEAMSVEGSRRRGRPKLRWEDRLKLDIKVGVDLSTSHHSHTTLSTGVYVVVVVVVNVPNELCRSEK
ncbi:hypothetical protein Tco_0610710 [Tanacetum coccineum]